jgi:protein disulfide-isomerase
MANLIQNPHLRPGSADLPPQSRYGAGHPAGGSGAMPPAQPVYTAQHMAAPGHLSRAQQTAATSPQGYTQQTAATLAQPAHAQPAMAALQPALPYQKLGSALDGYCPITLVEQNTWSKGDPRWGVEHRGRTYLFTSYVNQQRFLANPDLYSPVLSGYDAVRYFDQGELVEGKREHGLYYGDQYFLFADEASLERFHSAPQRYVAQTQAAIRGN